MMEDMGEPSAALLIRAWVEGEPSTGLRVRVIRIHQSDETSGASAGTVEATLEIVASWLNELLGEAAMRHCRPR
jgi:hypothetical protein